MTAENDKYTSLLKTLSFLDSIGAGDPLGDHPASKTDLSITSPQTISRHLKSVLAKQMPADLSHKKDKFPQNSSKNTYDKSIGEQTAIAISRANEPQNQKKPKPHLSPKTLVERPVIPKITPALHRQEKSANTDSFHTVSTAAPLQKQSDIVKRAIELAASAQSLEQLRDIIHNFEGCALKITATNTVFSDGNINSDIMLVGEAPGADEDRVGKPFVGRSGQLLDRMMAAIHLTRENHYYISNIIPWRPPGNRPPTPEETAICMPFIHRHIQLKNPKVLMCIGGTAAKALLKTKDSMGKLRGKWFNYDASLSQYNHNDTQHSPKMITIPTTVLFHPSYLLRSPGQKRLAWQDLQNIESFLLKS